MLRCQEPLYRHASFINGAVGVLQSVSKLCLFAGVMWNSVYGIQCRPADMTYWHCHTVPTVSYHGSFHSVIAFRLHLGLDIFEHRYEIWQCLFQRPSEMLPCGFIE
jgi:hypothetical protein